MNKFCRVVATRGGGWGKSRRKCGEFALYGAIRACVYPENATVSKSLLPTVFQSDLSLALSTHRFENNYWRRHVLLEMRTALEN
jgi:hypothetical protein